MGKWLPERMLLHHLGALLRHLKALLYSLRMLLRHLKGQVVAWKGALISPRGILTLPMRASDYLKGTLMLPKWQVVVSKVVSSGSNLFFSFRFFVNFQRVPSLISLSISSFNFWHSSIMWPWSSWKRQYFVLSHFSTFSGLSLGNTWFLYYFFWSTSRYEFVSHLA